MSVVFRYHCGLRVIKLNQLTEKNSVFENFSNKNFIQENWNNKISNIQALSSNFFDESEVLKAITCDKILHEREKQMKRGKTGNKVFFPS